MKQTIILLSILGLAVTALPDNSVNSFEERYALRQHLVGQMSPDFQVKDLAGQPRSSATYRGKVVLVDFWTTYCAFCLVEMPNVQSVYTRYRAQGFDVLGVSEDHQDVKPRLSAFVRAHNMTWPECFDDHALGRIFLVEEFPSNYLIGRDGRIIGMDLFGKNLDAAVARALAAK